MRTMTLWLWFLLLTTVSGCADGSDDEPATADLIGCSVSTVRYPTTYDDFRHVYDGRSFYADGNHLGHDIELIEGTAIHPIACGSVRFYGPAHGYGTLAVVVEHRLPTPLVVTNGLGERVTITTFLSIYGHLRSSRLRGGGGALAIRVGDTVGPDDVIGYAQNDAENGDGAEHLHLGIRLQSSVEARRTDTAWFRGYDGSPSMRRWFADPRDFLDVLMRSGVTVRWHPPGTVLARASRPGELWMVGADDLLHRMSTADAATDRLTDRVIPAFDAELDCFATGAAYAPELDDVRLVRFDGSSAVYEDHPSDATYRTFISYEAFVSWGWRDSEIDVHPASERSAFLSSHVDAGFRRLRDGTPVKARGESEVAIVSDGRRLPIADWTTFLALGYRAERIVELDPSVIDANAFARGPLLTAELAAYCAHPSLCVSGACPGGTHGGGTGEEEDATTPDASVASDASFPVGSGTRYEFRIRTDVGWGAVAPYRLRDRWWEPQSCLNTGATDLESMVDGWQRCDVAAPLSPFIGSFFSPAHPDWGDRGQIGTVGNDPVRCTPTAGVEWRITDLASGRSLYSGPASGLPCVSEDTQDRHALP